MLAAQSPIHVLILDVGVPTSQTNSSPYPILYLMPLLFQKNPDMNILVISMHKEQALTKALIKALIDAGASGYVFKDDRETLQKFSSVIRMIASGGIYFSRDAHKTIMRQSSHGFCESRYCPKAGAISCSNKSPVSRPNYQQNIQQLA